MSDESQGGLEARMQKLSVVISVIGLGLMVFGFASVIVHGASLSMPGMAAWSPKAIAKGARVSLSLACMSAGIVTLSLLPVLRVLLALSLYVRKRQLLNVLVACIVFVELLVSARGWA